MATSHSRFVELERIMAMLLTQDEQLVLRHLISGESSEEIAATLDWPLQAVRNCTHTLIIWVLDELEASRRTPSEFLPAPPPFA
jgi:DNA-binding NarL/FixJ family response regulator